MSVLISVPSATGDILIEVDRAAGGGPVTRGRTTDALDRVTKSFEDGWSHIKPIASEIIRQLSAAIDGTEEVKVKFGVKFSAEAGVFIASAATEANFAIEITWHKPRQ